MYTTLRGPNGVESDSSIFRGNTRELQVSSFPHSTQIEVSDVCVPELLIESTSRHLDRGFKTRAYFQNGDLLDLASRRIISRTAVFNIKVR